MTPETAYDMDITPEYALLLAIIRRVVYLSPADKSSMKTCVFTPPHETGILVLTLSRTPAAMTLAWGAKARGRRRHPGPIFFRPLMVKGVSLRHDR
jgi:hypothetical protein